MLNQNNVLQFNLLINDVGIFNENSKKNLLTFSNMILFLVSDCPFVEVMLP